MQRRGSLGLQTFASALTLGMLAASCTAILGIDKDYRESSAFPSGAGGTGGIAQGGGGNASGSSNSGGTGGGPPAIAVWHSWDMQTLGNPAKLFLRDINGQHEATIIPYQSKSSMDLGVDLMLAVFNFGAHPDMYNNVVGFWTITMASPYPYVSKSSVGRGMDGGEINTPPPIGVFDLQLFPPADTAKLIVAAFVVPVGADYTISSLSARRVIGTAGDNAQLRVFVGNAPVVALPQATKSQIWVTDNGTYHLGPLYPGAYINFAVDSLGDNTADATEIAWTITAQ